MDPAKMKVVDLRSELGALGLDTKGNKPALVERLKKALEAKTGKALPDTSVLDTSTEDVDEPATPRRPTPAARTTRRSSSSRLAATPIKIPPIRDEPPEPIAEEPKPGGGAYSPSQEDSDNDSPPPAKKAPAPVASPEPVKEPEPVKAPEPVASPEKAAPPTPVAVPEPVPAPEPVAAPQPVSAPEPVADPQPVAAPEPVAAPQPVAASESLAPPAPVPAPVAAPEPESAEELKNQSPRKDDAEPMEVQENPSAEGEEIKEKKYDVDDRMDQDRDDDRDRDGRKNERERELTEEEEWDQLNERLRIREQERLERERKQSEDDFKKLEEVSNDPVKLNRLKRKREKKARWSNFYRAVEVTNEVLAPPEDHHANKEKKESAEVKIAEPEIDDTKITLSWYDSDLNQYLEVPELNSVVPLSEGAFAHAWAGARASHGVDAGRVCYEVRVGTVLSANESLEKEPIGSGLRIGWSTDDSSLHLGEGELSWGFESSGRAVNNSEFKEYGKQLNEKDVVGAYLDLESNPCKISYTLNGAELGTAYEFEKAALNGKPVFPHLLTKNICYKVNFGYDKYNMLTKTKIVRKRIEIPVEQVLEEKRAKEAEIQRQKEEAAKQERERREKEKNEREERQKRKKEEREKQDRERKEREDAERKERGEEEPEAEVEKEKEKEPEKDKETEPIEENAEKMDEPKENGDQAAAEKEQAAEVKVEPMDAEPSEQPAADAEVKDEPVPEGELAEVTEEQVLQGHVLDSRIKFVIRYYVEEELDGSEVDLMAGYIFISSADIVEGPSRPASIADCEVILMVGMPGSGKTHWAKQRAASSAARRYNILSTGALFDRMKVDCKPFRASYDGRWDAMVSKCAKCVLKLLEIAKGRKRNFILDQTNVYPSAQRRKLREFDGYRRVAVVIVTDDETYRDRQKRREEADGKEVPDGAIVDMKANFTLPDKCSWLDEVLYPELGQDEARAVVEAYHREAKAAGVVRDKDKRERSATRDAPPTKRHRSNDKRHGRDDRRNRDFSRGEREDRWGGSNSSGGGGGGGRWGGSGGRGGSRWGPRDSRPAPPPNANRFERPWQGGPPQPGAPGPNGGGRYDNDFRSGGGRGGGGRGGGGRGERGGRGGGPPGHERFGRERHNRPNDRPDKRHHQPGGGGSGNNGGGGAGSWQRGGQAGNTRGAMQPRPGMNTHRPHQGNPKDGPNQNQNQNQQNQQGWNQWAGGWGGWGNWNQNQGWGNWGNWGNWNPQQQGSGGAGGASTGAPAAPGGAPGAKGQAAQQWPGNYTAQQWYQWQQWQQQQQQAGWPGYQQGNQTGNAADAQAWAQYYQNYGNQNASTAGNAVTGTEKK